MIKPIGMIIFQERVCGSLNQLADATRSGYETVMIKVEPKVSEILLQLEEAVVSSLIKSRMAVNKAAKSIKVKLMSVMKAEAIKQAAARDAYRKYIALEADKLAKEQAKLEQAAAQYDIMIQLEK